MTDQDSLRRVVDFNPHAAATLPGPLLPRIRALRLEIRTRWARPTIIPGPVIANVLRGALGITLRRLVCPEEWLDHDCHPCPLYGDCAYGQIFAPTPSADAAQLRLQQDLPRPFVIEPPGLAVGQVSNLPTAATNGPRPGPLPSGRDARCSDQGLTFGLVLFGTAIERLPYFISTLDRLGHDGMGRDRVPFTLERITARHPAGDETLFTGDSATVSLPARVITTDDLLCSSSGSRQTSAAPPRNNASRQTSEPAPTAPLNSGEFSYGVERPRITLHFLTPLLLKTGSRVDEHGRHIPAREVRDRPPLGVLIRRLRDRLSALCAFFGEPWQHPDFAAIGALADTVLLVDSRTTWLTRNRRSTRTGQQHELSGLVGEATYEFPNAETCAALVPLIRFAELLHVGKLAPWGNGAVRIAVPSGARSLSQGREGEVE